MPPTESTNEIISGSLRTLAQLIPVVGGAVAQAWSEYESIRQKQRTEEFFAQLQDHIAVIEQQRANLREKISLMPDAAELMELAVAAAKRETSETKRQLFPRMYSNFLATPSNTTPAERLDLIHHLEHLSDADLHLLQKFSNRNGILRGDMLTDTTMPEWEAVGGPPERDSAWLDKHGAIVHSLAKLEARGLVHEAMLNAASFSSGGLPNSFDRFRVKAWAITPMGRKILQSLRSI